MADPVITAIPVDTWVKVATGVTTGMVHILKTDPDRYVWTYRDTLGAAPTDDSESVPFNPALQISASAAIDVYVKTKGEAGSVRVDL